MKFKVLGSKFRKPRTSDLKPSSVQPVQPFPLVSHRSRLTRLPNQTFLMSHGCIVVEAVCSALDAHRLIGLIIFSRYIS